MDYLDEGKGLIDFATPGLQPRWPSYKRSRLPEYEDSSKPWSIHSDPNFMYPAPKHGIRQTQKEDNLIRISNELEGSYMDADPITQFLFELADGEKTHILSVIN